VQVVSLEVESNYLIVIQIVENIFYCIVYIPSDSFLDWLH